MDAVRAPRARVLCRVLGLACLAAPGITAAPTPAAAARRSPPGGGFLLAMGYPAEQAYSLALHIHGSMSEQYGSMEWHTAKAESLGVDVIWWSDHDWRLSNWRHLNKYDFESAFWDSLRYRWEEPDDAWSGNKRYWYLPPLSIQNLQTSLSDTLAYEGSRSLVLEAPGQPGPYFAVGQLEQKTMQINNRYSLAKHVRLSFALYPEVLDTTQTRFVLEVELSDHPEETKILRYVAGTTEGEGPHSIPLAFTPGEWNTFTVDVTSDAIAHFSTGGTDTLRAQDNTLGMVRIGLETKNATPARVLFDGYRITPDSSIVDDILLDRAREIGAYYGSLYPNVTHFAGTEISKYRAQPHLNGFAPNLQLVDYSGHGWEDTLYYAIEQIHNQGGAVSLNHIFGPRYDFQDDPNETPEHQAARLLWTKQSMIAVRAYGVDILEVGYRRRGGMDIVHHLDLWDALNGNAIFLTGNGVTDSHGRGEHDFVGWGPNVSMSTTNNFVTWLYAEEFSEAGFVKAMKRGRAYFGDPYAWQGTLDLHTLDGFRMGQVVYTDRDQHDLVVEVTNVPSNVQVRLLQGEIREDPPQDYSTVNYLRDEILSGAVAQGAFTDTLSLDTTLPSFVRIEAYDSAGAELVYSNPIHFVRAVPQLGIPAERVAVRLGETRVFLADAFELLGASYDSSLALLTILGNEEPVGLGELKIDPGSLGEPSGVSGAAGWAYVGGILTLQGFSGASSAVQVAWGATGARAIAQPTRLALWPASPNPFGERALITYALRRAGPVRLEIFDLHGRRVRVLVAAERPAGFHHVSWNGRDERGRSVAAGVYWVRLHAEGQSLVRRIVRLR